MDARVPDGAIARVSTRGVERWVRGEAGALLALDGPPWSGGRATGERPDPGESRLLAPVAPTKIVCVGLNYRAHVAESQTVVAGATPPDEPLLFLKPPSAIVGPGEPIRHPPGVTRMDPEAELALVVGRRARDTSPADALGHLAGFTCFNDVSARNYQKSDHQWARAKGFDTFAPVGPWIVPGLDPRALEVVCRVNGERRQHGFTRDLIFDVAWLVAHVSRIMTLEPGDVIATGTPAGVAPIAIGDRVEVEVTGVGVLANPVEAWR